MKYSKKDIDYEHTLVIVSPIVSEYLTFVEISVLKRCSTTVYTNVYLPRVLVDRPIIEGLGKMFIFHFVDYNRCNCNCSCIKTTEYCPFSWYYKVLTGISYPPSAFFIKLQKVYIEEKINKQIKYKKIESY